MNTTCPTCQYVRRPADTAPDGHCPQCGIVYAKYQAPPAIQSAVGPLPTVRTRPTSFPFIPLIAGVTFLAAAAYFVRDHLRAKPAPVAKVQKMSMLVKGDTGQGIPAYTVAQEGDRAVVRLLPDARKNLSQFAPSPVVLFSTTWCGYCAETRKFLDGANIRYTDHDVERDVDAMRYHGKVLRAQGVPVIVMGNQVLLGYDATEMRLASAGIAK